MELPVELTVMILGHCDGPTIVTCKRVSKQFLAVVDGQASLQGATFDRVLLNIMVKIMEDLASHGMRRFGGVIYSDETRRLLVFERLSTTYRALLHNHPVLASLVFRKGRVYKALKKNEISRRCSCSPDCQSNWCLVYASLKHVSLNSHDYANNNEAIEYLVETKAIYEFATRPPTTTLWLSCLNRKTFRSVRRKVNNDNGVRVRDLMAEYCNQPRPSHWQEQDSRWLIDVFVDGLYKGVPNLVTR